MANHRACIKHIRATKRRTIRNRTAMSALRTALRKVRDATTKKEAGEALQSAYSVVDKCVKSGLIHRNNAANKKSRLTLAVNSLAK
jgi:small subunit ribosomal protein S20